MQSVHGLHASSIIQCTHINTEDKKRKINTEKNFHKRQSKFQGKMRNNIVSINLASIKSKQTWWLNKSVAIF